MSRVEHKRGFLVKVGNSDEELCKKVYTEITGKDEHEEYYKSYTEAVEDELSDEIITHDSILYRLEDVIEISEDDDIADAEVVDLSTIKFEVRFYNGGASMREMIDEALDKINI